MFCVSFQPHQQFTTLNRLCKRREVKNFRKTSPAPHAEELGTSNARLQVRVKASGLSEKLL